MVRTGSRLVYVAAATCIRSLLAIRTVEPKRDLVPQGIGAALAFFDGRFQLQADLGYMSWNMTCSPEGELRYSAGDVKLEEVRCGLGADDVWQLPHAQPWRLEDLDNLRESLPRTLAFGRLDDGTAYFNPLPRALPSIAGPFVASKRFNVSKIDFIFGGSLLDTLATGDFHGKDYTAQRWHNAVMIRGYSVRPQYIDLKDKGFQIERLVTGKRMNDIYSSQTSVQHLQVLRIGEFNVLFIGKVDAMDEHGRLAEVTTAFAPNWKKLMFKMMAGGSTTLVRGIVEENWPNVSLNELGEYDLADIIDWTTTQAQRRLLAANIINSLRVIHSRVFNSTASNEALYRMNDTRFVRSKTAPFTHAPKLYRLKKVMRSLLPKADVMDVLFPRRTQLETGVAA